MTPTTTYIITDAPRARRNRPLTRRTAAWLLAGFFGPPAAAASLGITAAIAAGTHDAMTLERRPAAAPLFDTKTVDTKNATTLPLSAARYSPSDFDIAHSALRKCKTEDGSGSTLPCASNEHAGIKYIVFSAGRKKKGIKPVIALYRDGHFERYTI